LTSRHQMQSERRIAFRNGHTFACLAFGTPSGGATCVIVVFACDALHHWSWRQPLRCSRRNHRTLLESVDWRMGRGL